MLTLTDIVDNLLPIGTRRINGPPVTSVPIVRVSIIDSENDGPIVDRATLAIVTADAASEDTADVLSTAPAALIVSARHHMGEALVDYPVLMLPLGVEPRHVAQILDQRLHEQRTNLAMQGIDIYRRLAEIAIAGKGLSAIGASVAELLGLSISIVDEEWRPLYSFDGDGSEAPDSGNEIAWGLRDQLRPILDRERLSPSAPPVTRLALPGEPHTYVVAPIVLPGGPVGFIWTDASTGDLTPLVDVAIGHGATVCAIEMARQRAVLEAQLHLRGNFVEELLTEGYRSIEAMHQRARFLGHDVDGPHVVAIFDIDHFSHYIEARPVSGEAAIVKLKERFARLVADALASGDSALLWQQSDAVIVLLKAEGELTSPDLLKRVETVRGMVQARLAGPTISAGVGRVYGDPALLRRSYAEAREAARIGLATTGTSVTTPFDRLGVFRLLFRLRETPELMEFCDELLGPLERYDRARGADLVYTLERYLAANCNVARATEELHLHRNGLLYRLQRINDITKADFNDARQRLSYHLAILARSLG